MRYHFNEVTGKSAPCEASVRACPLIHGETAEEAQMEYERQMVSSVVSTMNKPYSKSKLQSMPSVILSRTPLKELDAAQLVQTLRHESAKLGMDVATIDSAIDLATILHAHQTRGNRGNFTKTPYIEHPLRNAVRLIRLGVTDQDVVVAAILHDTIEDGAKVFVEKFHKAFGKKADGDSKQSDAAPNEPDAREYLRRHVRFAYGGKVLELVDAVTNDYIADTDKAKMTLTEKNRIYLEHVKKNISGEPKVYLVKSADFIDNATGLYHNDIPSRASKTAKQASKYLPVVKIFQNALHEMDLPIPAKGIETIEEHLRNTEIRLQKIIDKYSDILSKTS